MQRLDKLPAEFKRFRTMGGVLQFAMFEDADGTEDDIVAAVTQLLADTNGAALRALGGRRIEERDFFGDWYDPASGHLVARGSFSTADGKTLENPTLRMLAKQRLTGSASPVPGAGAGGQFAYAFTRPPYGLRAKPREIQVVFDAIKAFILPPQADSEILDWSSPRLPEVSAYFRVGMDWWGVFLFSLYLPDLRRLTIVAGSATD